MPEDGGSRGARRWFATTQWSLVVSAGEDDGPRAREALTELCRAYWQPIYIYVRRRGAGDDRARDLTQGFFAKLLEKEYVKDARRERGRFRTFLLTSLKNFLANEWDREQAQRRGGGREPISLDALEAEDAYRTARSDDASPEEIFDRRWARTLLGESLERLGSEMTTDEQARRFDRLSPFLTGEGDGGYRKVASELEMTESAVKVAVHRMRARFRAIVREEVLRTVGDERLVDDELRHLQTVIGR